MVLYQLCFVDDAHPFGYEYLCDITCALRNKYVWDFVYWQSEIFYLVDKVDKDTYFGSYILWELVRIVLKLPLTMEYTLNQQQI